jgi:hypothetical protein
MILKATGAGTTEPYDRHEMAKVVRKLRRETGLPPTFTLDACCHGGMTELEEAELTDGQGRALSGHRTERAYEGYAKRTMERALPATRKRYAHALANTQGTSIQNAPRSGFQNEAEEDDAAIAYMTWWAGSALRLLGRSSTRGSRWANSAAARRRSRFTMTWWAGSAPRLNCRRAKRSLGSVRRCD